MRVLGEMDSIADEHEEFVKSLARGGVTVSYFEIVQDNSFFREENVVHERLDAKLERSYRMWARFTAATTA
jgi:glutamate dehydrogenase/leucine dehydrogenase